MRKLNKGVVVKMTEPADAYLRNGQVKMSAMEVYPTIAGNVNVITSKGQTASGGLYLHENDLIEFCKQVLLEAGVITQYELEKAEEEEGPVCEVCGKPAEYDSTIILCEKHLKESGQLLGNDELAEEFLEAKDYDENARKYWKILKGEL